MFELLLEVDPNPDVPGPHLAVLLGWIILGIAQLILFIAALVSVLASKRYTGGGKFLWVVVIFFAPLLGAIGWFVAGRRAQIRTSEP